MAGEYDDLRVGCLCAELNKHLNEISQVELRDIWNFKYKQREKLHIHAFDENIAIVRLDRKTKVLVRRYPDTRIFTRFVHDDLRERHECWCVTPLTGARKDQPLYRFAWQGSVLI